MIPFVGLVDFAIAIVLAEIALLPLLGRLGLHVPRASAELPNLLSAAALMVALRVLASDGPVLLATACLAAAGAMHTLHLVRTSRTARASVGAGRASTALDTAATTAETGRHVQRPM